MEQTDRFLRLKEVCSLTGLSRSTIYKMSKAETFPSSVKLGASATAWLHSEVQAWIDARVAVPERKPWMPPAPPPAAISEKKLPPLIPNEKGSEAAAKIAGVTGIPIDPNQEEVPDREIALRFPDWPAMMRRRTAAAYLDLTESAFIREVYRGTLPYPVKLGGRESWNKEALDAALATLLSKRPV